MEDIELYEWATDVLSSITQELNESYYKDLNGSLTLQLDTSNIVNAQAIIYSECNEPPMHSISITYKLIRTLYNDAITFTSYVYSGTDDEAYKLWYEDNNVYTKVREKWGRSEFAKNTFLAGLTWVYFHELGHLTQEHQFIRDRYSPGKNTISEIHLTNISTENEAAASIWHATEIAADYFATCMCVGEIIRQLGAGAGEAENNKLPDEENFDVPVCFLTCGISLMLHRFQGKNFFEEQTIPIGTHPKPFIRLEIIVPLIFEILSVPNTDLRRIYVKATSESTSRVSLYWIRATGIMEGIPEHYLIEGTQNRPGMIEYMSHIILAWDEISSEIAKKFTFGSQRMVLTFTKQLRDKTNLKYVTKLDE